MQPSIVIVGHGPSMKGTKLGKKIDAHDIVIRLKAGILNEDFGHKTTICCASTEVMGLFLKMEADEYWAYPKKGYFDGREAMNVIVMLNKPVLIPLELCNLFNEGFCQTASHPNVSTGMAAIMIAIDRYSPKELTLAGFDNLLDPDLEFERHPDVPSTGLGKKAGHDWKAENELLNKLPVRIKCLQ